MSDLEQRSVERIAAEFSSLEQDRVIGLLKTYSGPEPERVIWDIIELSKGSPERISHYVETARKDYRDILYWAEYYETDLMVQGRDARKLVDDLLAKWGGRKKHE